MPLAQEILNELNNPNLEEVDLSGKGLGHDPDAILELADRLAQMPHLRVLNLSHNDLGKLGVDTIGTVMKKLAQSQNLQELYLGDNSLQLVDFKGMQGILGAFRESQSLQVLDLSSNGLQTCFRGRGIGFLTIYLNEIKSLRRFIIKNTPLDDDQKTWFSNMFEHVNNIYELDGIEAPQEYLVRNCISRINQAIEQYQALISPTQEEIQAMRTEVRAQDRTDLTEAEAAVSLRIKALNKHIKALQAEVAEAETVVSRELDANLKLTLQAKIDNCYSAIDDCWFRQADIFEDRYVIERRQSPAKAPERRQQAIDALLEVPETSPRFFEARSSAFEIACAQYGDEGYSPAETFFNSLPILVMQDTVLVMEYTTLLIHFDKQKQSTFDNLLLEVVVGSFSERSGSLRPKERTALLQEGLLQHIKETIEKDTQGAGAASHLLEKSSPLLSQSSKSEVALTENYRPLLNALNQLPPDPTNWRDGEHQNQVREIFTTVRERLTEINKNKPAEAQSTEWLKELDNWISLMQALQPESLIAEQEASTTATKSTRGSI